ncbi:MAG TPA: alpha/beta hydrolase [Pseudonocardia sp.]
MEQHPPERTTGADPVPTWFTEALAAPVRVDEVAVDGVPIRYRAWGEPGDEGLVLVHGGAAHGHWWDHIGPLLASTGHRVLALDLSGHGDSGRREAYGLESWSDEVLAVAEHGGAGAAPVIIGHSMGGMVALRAALRFGSRLGGIVVIDTPVRDLSPEELAARRRQAFGPKRTYPSRERAIRHFRPVPPQPGALPFVVAHLAEHSVAPVDGGWAWKFDHRVFGGQGIRPEQLGQVDCRVGLFRAEHGMVPEAMGQDIHDRMGRIVPVIEIPAAHHHVLIDQPLALVTALRTLLADWRHSTPLAERAGGVGAAG